MSSPSWLPPLNSHDQYATLALLHEFQLPQDHGWCIPEQSFVMHIDVSVKFHSSTHRNPFEGLLLHKEFCIPCKFITDEPYSEVIDYISSLLLYRVRIPFQLDRILLVQQHLDSQMIETSWEENNRDLVQKFHHFLNCMKGKIYNSSHQILPVKLEINKIVQVSDEEYCMWISWLDAKKRVDPNFEKYYREAISRPRTFEELCYEASIKSMGATIVLNDSSSMSDCVVCFRKRPKPKLIRLPCSHIFHGDCIMRWLEERETCPLCCSIVPVVLFYSQISTSV